MRKGSVFSFFGQTRFSAVLSFFGLLVRRFVDERSFQIAASLTFTTLLSLVPLVAVSAVLLSHFEWFSKLGEVLKSFLLANLLPETAGQVIARYTFQFSQKALGVTVIGSGMLFVAALMMVVTIDQAFNHLWGVAARRPSVKRLVVYLLVILIGPIVLGGALAFATYLLTVSLGVVNDPPWLNRVAFRGLPLFFIVTLFFFAFRFIPDRRVAPHHALVGGVVTAVLLMLLQQLFSLYLSFVPTYTVVYGAFATIPIFLLWVYLSWSVVLVGALVAATLPERIADRKRSPAFPGRRFYGALLILRELYVVCSCMRPLSLKKIAEAGGVTIKEAQLLLSEMQYAGWAISFNDESWLPGRSAAYITLSEVLELFALAPDRLPIPDGASERALQIALVSKLNIVKSVMKTPLARLFGETGC